MKGVDGREAMIKQAAKAMERADAGWRVTIGREASRRHYDRLARAALAPFQSRLTACKKKLAEKHKVINEQTTDKLVLKSRLTALEAELDEALDLLAQTARDSHYRTIAEDGEDYSLEDCSTSKCRRAVALLRKHGRL
jgi:hypothetical protein